MKYNSASQYSAEALKIKTWSLLTSSTSLFLQLRHDTKFISLHYYTIYKLKGVTCVGPYKFDRLPGHESVVGTDKRGLSIPYSKLLFQ